jgi:eukaryotic-like serine/threonine-protein kinase
LVALLGAVVTLARAPGGSTAVPNVVGLTTSGAEAGIQRVGLGVETRFRRDRAPKGTVIEQGTRPGVWQADGKPVVIVVSRGPKPIRFANLVGQPVDAATTTLQNLGFVVDATTRKNDEQAPVDTVIASDPTGGAAPDSIVKLIVSAGPAPRAVPDVGTGGSYADAAAKIEAVQLVPVRSDQFSDTVAAGQVMGSDPGSGAQVPRDSQVSVNVSKGPDLVTVPALANQPIEAASQSLAALGLQATVQGNYRPGGKVIASDPPANTQVKRGSTIRLFL